MDIERLYAYFVLGLDCNFIVAESMTFHVLIFETGKMFVNSIRQKANTLGLTQTSDPGWYLVLSKGPVKYQSIHRLPVLGVVIPTMKDNDNFSLVYSTLTQCGVLEFRHFLSKSWMKINNVPASRNEFYQAINGILESLAAGIPYPDYPHTIRLRDSVSL